MRGTYTRMVIGAAKKAGFIISIDPSSEDHPAVPYAATLAESLSAKIYFAHPYASWERGLNENINGLIRKYLPKSRPLDNVTEKELKYIIDRLNHRPRKTLI